MVENSTRIEEQTEKAEELRMMSGSPDTGSCPLVMAHQESRTRSPGNDAPSPNMQSMIHKPTNEVHIYRQPDQREGSPTITSVFVDNTNDVSSDSGHETDHSRTLSDSSVSSVSSSPETNMSVNSSSPPPVVVPHVPVSQSGTPIAPPLNPPPKRRPGRPPGSTKKAKATALAEMRMRKPESGEDNYSLRKFFELGGRDYNEYLEWLKKTSPQHQQNVNNNMTPQKMQGPMAFSSPNPVVTSMAPMPPATLSPVTPVSYSQGPPPGPQMFSRQMSQLPPPPPPYRNAVMIPRPQPGSHTPTIPPPPLIQFTRMSPYPMMPTSVRPMIPPVSSPQLSPCVPQNFHHREPELESAALDLSAKKRSAASMDDADRALLMERHPKFTKTEPESVLMHPHIMPCGSPVSTHIDHNTDMESVAKTVITPPRTPELVRLSEVASRVSSTETTDIESWDVDRVVRFVTSVPGCQEYAEVFREHRIDGTTLPHLSESHLLNFVKMKLGPAIRLRLAITNLKGSP